MTSLLAVLTVKVSAILLLTLVGALCLRTRSAAARRWGGPSPDKSDATDDTL